MQTLNTRGDAKKLASSLRKALKTLNPSSELSHSHACEAIAMAFGFKNWSAFAATLPESAPAPQAAEPAVVETRYPLSNTDGRFDFAKEGVLAHGVSFEVTHSTVEDIEWCTAGVNGVTRKPNGRIDIEYAGETDVNWDGQTTRKDDRGIALWNFDGYGVPEDRLILVPEGFDPDDLDEEDCELKPREALLEAYVEYLRDKALLDQAKKLANEDAEAFRTLLQKHEKAIGFALVPAEFEALRKLTLAS